MISYKNSEWYNDPTVYEALENIEKIETIEDLFKNFNDKINQKGFKIFSYDFIVEDEKTGKKYIINCKGVKQL